MRCPKCGGIEDKVIDSRSSKDGLSIRRRRECFDCHYRFTTYEQIEPVDLRVVKRDGSFEPFDRLKILNGLRKACQKRSVSMAQIEALVEDITQDLESSYGNTEFDTRVIGAKVMEKLYGLDEVAYIRYASVYRQFQDIGEFIEEIRSLEKKVKPSTLQPELFPVTCEPAKLPPKEVEPL